MFEDDTKTTSQEGQEQKFTIGDQEYTQDELNDLVSLGSKARDIQKNHGDLDNLVSDWGRTKSEIGELRKFKEELEARQTQERAQSGQLSQEEQVRLAKQEAAKLGFITDDNVSEYISTQIETKELERETDGLVEELSDMGINADPQIIIRYMDSADLDNPVDAAQQLYGDRIKDWQEKQLEENKPESWLTQTGNSAGGTRNPEQIKVTDANLADMFKEAIGAD